MSDTEESIGSDDIETTPNPESAEANDAPGDTQEPTDESGTGNAQEAKVDAPKNGDGQGSDEDTPEQKPHRSGKKLVALVTAIVVVLAAGVAVWWLWPNPTLERADKDLWQQIVDADQAMTAASDDLSAKISLVTTGQVPATDDDQTPGVSSSPSGSATPEESGSSSGDATPSDDASTPSGADTPAEPVPDTRADWGKVLLTTDDPAVIIARQFLLDATAWHDWAALVTGNQTTVTSKVTVKIGGQKKTPYDLPWAPVAATSDTTVSPADSSPSGATISPSGSPSETAAPSGETTPAGTPSDAAATPLNTPSDDETSSVPAQTEPGEAQGVPDDLISLTITLDYARGLLAVLDAQTTALTAQVDALAAAFAAAQSAKAMEAYTPALDGLNAALTTAQALLDGSSGKVMDDATRQALQAAITAATGVRNANGNMTAADTAAAIAAATQALNDAAVTLQAPSDAVTASQAAWQAEQDRIAAQQRSSGSSSSSSSRSSSSGGGNSSGSGSSSGCSWPDNWPARCGPNYQNGCITNGGTWVNGKCQMPPAKGCPAGQVPTGIGQGGLHCAPIGTLYGSVNGQCGYNQTKTADGNCLVTG